MAIESIMAQKLLVHLAEHNLENEVVARWSEGAGTSTSAASSIRKPGERVPECVQDIELDVLDIRR